MGSNYRDGKGAAIRRNNQTPSDSVLRRIQFYFNALQRNTDNYLFVTDIGYNMVMVSNNLAKDFGLPGEVFEDMDRYWQPLIHPDDIDRYLQSMTDMVPSDGSSAKTSGHDLMYRVKRVDGEYQWIRCRGVLSYDRRTGNPFMFVGIISKLNEASQADHVTGLLSKQRFENTVIDALEYYHSDGIGGAIMIFGLDNFKLINETYNRNTGDNLLRKVARVLDSVLDENQLLYKLDGDEFGVVCPGMTEAEAEYLFRKAQRGMNTIQEIDGHNVFCTISAGTVFYPQGGKDYQVLHKHAEVALDLAKHAGKNQNCVFSREQYNRWLRSRSLREDMRASVGEDFKGFELYFQPQVSAKDKRILGAEALLRWFNANGRMVSPMEFIPILEETKLIIPVGRWILETGIRICKEFQQLLPGFRMSINLSYEQLRDTSIRGFVEYCLEKYQLEPKCVVLELTETSIMNDWTFVNEQFNELRKTGIMIAMDDFGTGYSSLACLKSLSCDIVKIDRAFVTNITENDFDQRLVKSTIDICHSINIKCCIEGVETEDEYNMVTDNCGADSIQGYLFGRPEPQQVFIDKYLSEKTEE